MKLKLVEVVELVVVGLWWVVVLVVIGLVGSMK